MLPQLHWTVTVEQDIKTGDLVLPLPEDLIELQDWRDGDTLEWIENTDGSWTLRKLEP